MLVIGADNSDDEGPPTRLHPPPEVVAPTPRVPGAAVRRLWPHTVLLRDKPATVVRIPPVVGTHIQDPIANDPQDLDLDTACDTMLTLDLPALFGIMARPANRRIHVRDLPEFWDWLHVISDPIVVKVFAGSIDGHMEVF